ncbi:hypothetical protein [Flectobacillus major]|uniref:hypothetical protein n=1 Tax=Flectobacillus major TaxID=103 RepID=UPI0003F7AEE3|nr:hypothetical protein [Flectobacillus major]
MIVQHQALALDWLTANDLNNPTSLVLGSFNPFNPNGQAGLDYYYGRTTNQFWKSIARIIGQPELYFFNQQHGLNRKIEVMTARFCCLDVIDSIDFECYNEEILTDYLNRKIFGEFADQTIWTTSTNRSGETINLKRSYNNSILELLRESQSIRKVIHTMGSRIESFNNIKPVELNGDPIGFKQYVREIISICEERGIEFSFYSLSPSQYAVNTGATQIADLDNWLRNNLNL